MDDLGDRFRAASASAKAIFWRAPRAPAEMFRDLAAFAEEHGIERDVYGDRGAVASSRARSPSCSASRRR
jgi:hypothetical protein